MTLEKQKEIINDPLNRSLLKNISACFGTRSLIKQHELLDALRKNTEHKNLDSNKLHKFLKLFVGCYEFDYKHKTWKKLSNARIIGEIIQSLEDIGSIEDREPNDLSTNQLDFNSITIHPLPWQERALKDWNKKKCRGIVEAVTGTGKTFLGIAAWELLDNKSNRPLHCMIVVPTIPIMKQWVRKLEMHYPNLNIAKRGDGHKDTFAKGRVMVAVIDSVRKEYSKLLRNNMANHSDSLLIADECHRYIDAPENGKIKEYKWDAVLALSATVNQEKVEGFGEKFFTYTFSEAAKDGVIAKFKMLNISTSLNQTERVEYENLTDKILEQLNIIKNKFPEEFGCPPNDNDLINGFDFFKTLKKLNNNGDEDPDITKFYGLIFHRESLIHQCDEKLKLADKIIPRLLQSNRKVIGFFERIENAEDSKLQTEADALALKATQNLSDKLSNNSLCEIYHSKLNNKDREIVLKNFGYADYGLLLTCRALDEGYDLPDIDVALLVSSTKNKRQRIQRVGRAIRAKEGKESLIISLYVENTTDVKTMWDDKALFGDAAQIESCEANEAIKRIELLLTKKT